MKLASLKNNKKDGVLVVVSRDLTRCIEVPSIHTLQQAIETWEASEPTLKSIYGALNQQIDKGEPLIQPKLIRPCPALINGWMAARM